MVEYNKINCKLTNVQLNEFKRAVKSLLKFWYFIKRS